MENIRLRVSNTARPEVLKLIRTFRDEMQKSTDLLNWHIYCHAMIMGDFSILLQWNTAQIDQEGSMLAYNLVKVLSPLGVVDHTIWIEQTGLNEE